MGFKKSVVTKLLQNYTEYCDHNRSIRRKQSKFSGSSKAIYRDLKGIERVAKRSVKKYAPQANVENNTVKGIGKTILNRGFLIKITTRVKKV